MKTANTLLSSSIITPNIETSLKNRINDLVLKKSRMEHLCIQFFNLYTRHCQIFNMDYFNSFTDSISLDLSFIKSFQDFFSQETNDETIRICNTAYTDKLNSILKTIDKIDIQITNLEYELRAYSYKI